MAKRKEIKFKNNRGSYEGRQDGVIYRIHADRTLLGTCAPAYAVSTYDTKGKGRGINTSGHFRLHLDDAKEFCQKIANGEGRPAPGQAKRRRSGRGGHRLVCGAIRL